MSPALDACISKAAAVLEGTISDRKFQTQPGMSAPFHLKI